MTMSADKKERGNKNMKKILKVLFLLIVISSCMNFASAEEQIKVMIDGETVAFDQSPVIRDDRVFVPIRAIAEGMNANVEYANGGVYIKGDGMELSLNTSGSHYYQLNGMENCILDSAPFILNDRTLVPVRVVAQSFSCDVQWDSANKTVIINRIEKGNYDKYKVDKEKPLVVDAMCYEYKETHYKIPKLNIKGTVADEINNRILLERAGNISEIKNVHEQGYDSGCWRETYAYSVYGNILSVLTAVYYDGGTVIHKTINYDMENDKELSFDDVMTLCGVDKNEHIIATHDKCAELYDRVWGYTLNMGWMTEELYYNNRAMAKTEECYSEKSQLYITDSGCVMSIIDFPSLAGAGSYEYLYDAGLKISMTEIKKEPAPLNVVGKWYWSEPEVSVEQLIAGKVTEYVGDGFEFGSISFNDDGTYNCYDMSCLWYTDQTTGESFYDGARGAGFLKGKYDINGNVITLHNEEEAYLQHNDDCSWIWSADIIVQISDDTMKITDVICDGEYDESTFSTEKTFYR